MQSQVGPKWMSERAIAIGAIPISAGIAIWGSSFWWSLLMAALLNAVVVLAIASFWVRSYRQAFKEWKDSTSLQVAVPAIADVNRLVEERLPRLVGTQTLSGALIGALWFVIVRGLIAVLT